MPQERIYPEWKGIKVLVRNIRRKIHRGELHWTAASGGSYECPNGAGIKLRIHLYNDVIDLFMQEGDVGRLVYSGSQLAGLLGDVQKQIDARAKAESLRRRKDQENAIIDTFREKAPEYLSENVGRDA